MRQVVDLWPWKTRSVLGREATELVLGREIGRASNARPWAEFFSQWTWDQWGQWAMKGRRRGMPPWNIDSLEPIKNEQRLRGIRR